MSTEMVKACQIFFIDDGTVLVEGVDFEPTGPGGLVSKVKTRLAPEAIPGLLGIVVLQTLEKTKVVNGAQWDEKDAVAGRALLSGIENNRTFMQRAKCLDVSVNGAEIQVMPTALQSDSGGWYKHLPDKKAKCRAIPDEVRDLLLVKVAECLSA